MERWATVLGAAVGIVACGGPAVPRATAGGPAARREPELERVVLDVDVDGLSGLTLDGAGTPWSVAESTRALVRIDPDGTARVVPIEGVPDEIDTESIAWLEESRFAVGTESTDTSRTADPILTVEVREDSARVIDVLALPYATLGIVAEENRGVEGICHADGILVAAMENVVTDGGRRYAPFALHVDGAWVVTRAALTTETGKISGLWCRMRDGALDVLAIERHYEVMRLLRYRIRPHDASSEPEIVRDLAGRLEGDPNLEGLAVDAAGDALLVVDNYYGERTGPNEVVRVPAVL